MSIITYAQNFEDVMLWRALKQVDHGFYIDAGGYSPTVDSVTKLFYDRGWHGINIEPNPHLFPAFQQQRPHDINLQVAVGDCEAFLPFTIIMAPEDVPNNGGLSTLEQDIAEKDAKAGMKVERIIVPVKTIKTIWKEHVPKGQPVHFFKIDVEGFEKKTIQGNNWDENRPWVVVVESTMPLSQQENYQEWEPLLLNAHYLFAYADGLNRFYVAGERRELLQAFKYPPNVFDEMTSHFIVEQNGRIDQIQRQLQEANALCAEANKKESVAESLAQNSQARAVNAEQLVHSVELRAQTAEQRVKETEALVQKTEQEVKDTEVRALAAEQKIIELHKSFCWKVTAPYRFIADAIKRLFHSIKLFLKRIVRSLAPWVLRTPWVKAVAKCILAPFPGLKFRIQRAATYSEPQANTPLVRQEVSQKPENVKRENVKQEEKNKLTPRALEIYKMLLSARNKEDLR